MIQIVVPGRGSYALEHLVLDLNGTITLDGSLIEGVSVRLERLKDYLQVVFITADTRGTARGLADTLRVQWHKVEPGSESEQKATLVGQLGSQATVAIGNGANDVAMLKSAALSICVIGAEGAAAEAVASSDLIVPSANDALDLLLKPERLIATLRR